MRLELPTGFAKLIFTDWPLKYYTARIVKLCLEGGSSDWLAKLPSVRSGFETYIAVW